MNVVLAFEAILVEMFLEYRYSVMTFAGRGWGEREVHQLPYVT